MLEPQREQPGQRQHLVHWVDALRAGLAERFGRVGHHFLLPSPAARGRPSLRPPPGARWPGVPRLKGLGLDDHRARGGSQDRNGESRVRRVRAARQGRSVGGRSVGGWSAQPRRAAHEGRQSRSVNLRAIRRQQRNGQTFTPAVRTIRLRPDFPLISGTEIVPLPIRPLRRDATNVASSSSRPQACNTRQPSRSSRRDGYRLRCLRPSGNQRSSEMLHVYAAEWLHYRCDLTGWVRVFCGVSRFHDRN